MRGSRNAGKRIAQLTPLARFRKYFVLGRSPQRTTPIASFKYSPSGNAGTTG